MAKKTITKHTFGKGFTVTDEKGNKEVFIYDKTPFKEGYYGNKGTVMEKDIAGMLYKKDSNQRVGEVFSKGPLSGDYYGDKGSFISKELIDRNKSEANTKKSNNSFYKTNNNSVNICDEMLEEGEQFVKQQVADHLKNRGKKYQAIGTSPELSVLKKYITNKEYTKKEEKEYLKYAASLLLKNNISMNADVKLSDEAVKRKVIDKFGPFNLLFKLKFESIKIPKLKGWKIFDAYDNDYNVSDEIDDEETHNDVLLSPDGKIYLYSYEDIIWVYDYKRKNVYERTNEVLKEKKDNDTINTWDKGGVEVITLIDYYLSSNKIDMSFEKYLEEKPKYDNKYLEEYESDFKKEKKKLQEPTINYVGKYNTFHYIAAILSALSFITGPKITSGILYVLGISIWIGLYPASLYDRESIKPKNINSIGHEIVVSILTSFCIFVKYGANNYLFGGHYDNELSLVFLSGIIVVMIASAVYKIFNKEDTSIKTIDNKNINVSKKGRIIICLSLCLDGLLRLLGRYIFSWYDPLIYTASFIILFIEAILVYLNKDKKIIWGLGILYLLFNFKVIRAMIYGSFHLGSLTDPGFQILYTVIINFILLSIYTILDKKD